MRTIPHKENLTVEFKSDIKKLPDNELIDEIVGMWDIAKRSVMEKYSQYVSVWLTILIHSHAGDYGLASP